VLLASYGAIDLLLTGDSESEVTRLLPLRPVEVLKVAHHGSSDPGLADELQVLRPRVAVISVGAHNDYGHPRADTLAALHARPGLRVYRTDESGRIVLESDGRTLRIRTERRVRYEG
jgi:competence protein ComEC